MKKLIYFGLATLLLAAMFGCTNVVSSKAPAENVTGEIWYVKSTAFPPGLVWSTSVFYCPEPTGKGSANCTEAVIHEDVVPMGGGGGFGAPAPQPAYGAPAQPAPAAPAYGAPAQPAYGQPAPQPGYAPQPQPQPAPAPPPPSFNSAEDEELIEEIE